MIERKFGKFPKWMRFDNGKELINAETKAWAAERGIEIQATAPYSQSQNGVAERFNRTHLELARAMLISKKLPDFLWDEAVSHANYLRNRAPTRALKGRTPYEAWNGHKPDISHLREFGCDVWVLDEAINRSKLHPKSLKMIFVGFNDATKSVRYYDAKHRSIKISRNFTFNENEEPRGLEITTELPGLPSEGEPEPITNAKTVEEEPQEIKIEDLIEKHREGRQLRERTTRIDYSKVHNPQSRTPSSRFNSPTPIQDPTRSTEASRAKQVEQTHMAINDEYSMISFKEDDLPLNIEEALSGRDKDEWKKAIDEELGILHQMGTWELANLPEGRNPIGCKWVFTKKRNAERKVIKFKARLVAQGFSQKPGIDYSNDGTFAPVMRFETLRALIALAAIYGWDLRQLDVKGAYLNGYLEEELYMRQPPGFDDGTGRVCRLRRSLYGLKQAGNVWNKEFDTAMIDLGFQRLKTDYCCYKRQDGDEFEILLVWVDDILSIASTTSRNDLLEQQLRQKFDIKSLGRPSMLLGMKITQDIKRQTISISQTAYIDQLLKKFGLQDCNPVSTPMDPNIKLDRPGESQDDEQAPNEASASYATLIGSLMYLARGSRPDIAYATQKLAQYTKNPQPVHWTAVKRIFRYLKGTRNYALTYGGSEDELNEDLNIYCDADWASDADRKSISGYVFKIAGGAVAWSAKKQSTVALSTAEAEYTAATHCAKQVLWYRSLFTELGINIPTTSTIFTDNQAAVSIAHHPEFYSRTKHIDISLHFLRDLVQNGTLNTVYINTEDNLADLFTKGLPRTLHQDFTQEIGVLDMSE